jgi:hypothetical protein
VYFLPDDADRLQPPKRRVFLIKDRRWITLKKFRIVFWDALSGMMEAARTSETLVNNYFTRQYIPEDNSELHTRRRENLKSRNVQ